MAMGASPFQQRTKLNLVPSSDSGVMKDMRQFNRENLKKRALNYSQQINSPLVSKMSNNKLSTVKIKGPNKMSSFGGAKIAYSKLANDPLTMRTGLNQVTGDSINQSSRNLIQNTIDNQNSMNSYVKLANKNNLKEI